MAEWVLKDFQGQMSLESRFLTLWGARRALRKAGFLPGQADSQVHYARQASSEICAYADVRRGIGDNRIVASIRPYDRDNASTLSIDLKGGTVVRWLMRETSSDVWFEGYPATPADAHQILHQSGFRRVAEDIEGHYKREWPSGIVALADVTAKATPCIVEIRYYDETGTPIRDLVNLVRAASGKA